MRVWRKPPLVSMMPSVPPGNLKAFAGGRGAAVACRLQKGVTSALYAQVALWLVARQGVVVVGVVEDFTTMRSSQCHWCCPPWLLQQGERPTP